MLIHPLPDPIALKVGPFAIHWYGLMYLLGFMMFLFFGRIRIRQPHMAKAGWTQKNLDDMLFYGVAGVIIGGRLGEVLFYSPAYYFSHPLDIFAIWQGGMSYHGGAVGVAIAAWLWSKKNDRGFLEIMDLIAPLVTFGYITGRIGNFINAELPGRVADPALPWAMVWPNVDMRPRHPSPVYQALLDGLLVAVVLWTYARKTRPLGAVTAFYCLLYGLTRFFTEYFRIPDYQVPIGSFTISAGQLLSVPMIVVGLAGLFIAYRTPSRKTFP
jgi:phosphatidylglycerol:prolipoprotein diacylglycerol transferase